MSAITLMLHITCILCPSFFTWIPSAVLNLTASPPGVHIPWGQVIFRTEVFGFKLTHLPLSDSSDFWSDAEQIKSPSSLRTQLLSECQSWVTLRAWWDEEWGRITPHKRSLSQGSLFTYYWETPTGRKESSQDSLFFILHSFRLPLTNVDQLELLQSRPPPFPTGTLELFLVLRCTGLTRDITEISMKQVFYPLFV